MPQVAHRPLLYDAGAADAHAVAPPQGKEALPHLGQGRVGGGLGSHLQHHPQILGANGAAAPRYPPLPLREDQGGGPSRPQAELLRSGLRGLVQPFQGSPQGRGQQRRRLAEPPGIPMYHTPHILRVPVWDIPMSARPLLCRGTQKRGRRKHTAPPWTIHDSVLRAAPQMVTPPGL